MQEGVLNEPIFSFYLGNQYPDELILGGKNEKHYTGPINYIIPVSSTSA
jgi:Eukaryotic aspartyl protease